MVRLAIVGMIGWATAVAAQPAPGQPAPAPGQPAPGQPPPAPPAPAPHSIQLEILDGSGQDFVKAKYRPGSRLRLGATIRDAAGNVLGPGSGCTPQYKIANASGADGQPRARLDGAGVEFLDATGAFSISVHCLENPQITSEAGQAPFNFETSKDTFAKCNGCTRPRTPNVAPRPTTPVVTGTSTAAPKPAPKAGGGAGVVLLGGLLAAGVVAAVVAATPGGEEEADGDRCNCFCNSGEDCTQGGQTFCMRNGDMFNICGCPVGNGCDGHGNPTFAPTKARPIRNVNDLVTRGIAARAPTKRAAPSPRPASPRMWLGASVVGAAIAAYAITTWLSRDEGLDVDVWVSGTSTGLTLSGRF
jgi:hypothetical protein